LKVFLARRLVVVAALLSSFVVALSVGVPAAEAALVRGRGVRSFPSGSGIVHGVGPAIIISLAVFSLLALAYVIAARGSRDAAAAEVVALPLRNNSSAESDRKAA
jgi:hypothetical protein